MPLQEHVAFISEEDLENPHIRYFDHLNPGWDKVCITPIQPTGTHCIASLLAMYIAI